MTQQSQLFTHDMSAEAWKEELARAKKFKEATQRRRHEKQASKQIETLKKASHVGRLKIEP